MYRFLILILISNTALSSVRDCALTLILASHKELTFLVDELAELQITSETLSGTRDPGVAFALSSKFGERLGELHGLLMSEFSYEQSSESLRAFIAARSRTRQQLKGSAQIAVDSKREAVAAQESRELWTQRFVDTSNHGDLPLIEDVSGNPVDGSILIRGGRVGTQRLSYVKFGVDQDISRLINTTNAHGQSYINDTAFSNDGRLLALVGADGKASLVELSQPHLVAEKIETADVFLSDNLYPVAFHPSGRYLVLGGNSGRLGVVDLTSSSRVVTAIEAASLNGMAIKKLQFTHDGKYLLYTNGVEIFFVNLGNQPLSSSLVVGASKLLKNHGVVDLNVSADSQLLFVTGMNGRAAVVDLSQEPFLVTAIATKRAHGLSHMHLALPSSDGKRLFLTSEVSGVSVTDLSARKLMAKSIDSIGGIHKQSWVDSLILVPGGRFLMALSSGGGLSVTDLADSRYPSKEVMLEGHINKIDLSADGQLLYVLDFESKVSVWKMRHLLDSVGFGP